MNFIFIIIIVVFIIGYACIALETPLKINKTASALLLGVILWTLMVIGGESTIINPELKNLFLHENPGGDGFMNWIVSHELVTHLGGIAEILFFLLGAMTIVELVDTYGGFKIITDKLKTTSRVRFMWILALLTFFMSSVLDNMTTTIVMVALLRKLLAEREERWFYAGLIVLAANAGGAWSPIGDVTTIMLWVGGKVSAGGIIHKTFLASFMCILVPMLILTFRLKGEFIRPKNMEMTADENPENQASYKERLLILIAGVSVLLFVPIFKALTHLPPYIGMLGGLSSLWLLTEILKRRHPKRDNNKYAVATILTKIDTPSILFFLGILLAVAALQVCGHLTILSTSLESLPLQEPERYFVISYIIGLFSAIIDNVPLVAGAMGMYNFPMNHYFWEFIAYCAGTGGSILIIGSAAGVAAMGLEKIDFIWYLKKISWLAFIGYTAGALTYIIQNYSSIKSDITELEPQSKMIEYTTNENDFQGNVYVLKEEMGAFQIVVNF